MLIIISDNPMSVGMQLLISIKHNYYKEPVSPLPKK